MDQVHTPSGASIETLKRLIPTLNAERLLKAERFIQETYGDRSYDLMDMTLQSHVRGVAVLLAEFCSDEDAVIACLLQHALKVPGVTLKQLKDQFGRNVRDIVSRIHLLSHLYTSDWRKSVDDMKIMLVSVSDDIRVLLVALAVQSYFMEHLPVVRQEYRARLARQSLQLFAPVAARLGIYALKYRLERDAFPECYPTDAVHITTQLTRMHEEHGQFLDSVVGQLKKFLAGEGVQAEVVAREKQSYSIFRKMHVKSLSDLQKISDLFAIRVVVPTPPDCYQVLGLLHRLATPLSHRFKDYISFPKPNGYQSLHTCLLGLPGAPKDLVVEVQIRTYEMHREAEYGIAAHWLYKEQGRNRILHSVSRLQLSDVLSKQQVVGTNDGAGDSGGQDFKLVDHIYVLTPKGDIIELPDGGTPLDFAFILHTNLGLRFKAARVNGGIVPLSYKLENGDIVEILTHKYPRPTLQWLEELVTSSARSKLKAFFFAHNRPQFLLKGREAVNAELKARGLPPLDNDLAVLGTFDREALSMKEREDLLVKVGMGSVRTSTVLRHIFETPLPRKGTSQSKPKGKEKKKEGESIVIEGAPHGMPYRFAKCCHPDQLTPRPETIVGIVTRAGTVSIHKDGCHMAKTANPNRSVAVRWA
jgi:GTP pyrophosphokinase